MVKALQFTAAQPPWSKPAGVTHLLVVSLSWGELTAGLMQGCGPSLLVVWANCSLLALLIQMPLMWQECTTEETLVGTWEHSLKLASGSAAGTNTICMCFLFVWKLSSSPFIFWQTSHGMSHNLGYRPLPEVRMHDLHFNPPAGQKRI